MWEGMGRSLPPLGVGLSHSHQSPLQGRIGQQSVIYHYPVWVAVCCWRQESYIIYIVYCGEAHAKCNICITGFPQMLQKKFGDFPITISQFSMTLCSNSSFAAFCEKVRKRRHSELMLNCLITHKKKYKKEECMRVT